MYHLNGATALVTGVSEACALGQFGRPMNWPGRE